MDFRPRNGGPIAFVLGGGFAGVQAARALLARAPEIRVVLVEKNNYSTMIPVLPDVLSGRVRRSRVTRPLEDVFPRRHRDRLEFLRGTAERIDLDKRELLVDGVSYSWDSLVIATGSVPFLPGITDAAQTVHTIHTMNDVTALRDAFFKRAAKGETVSVLIVGAGYTGLEVASSLRRGADRAELPQPEITIVEIGDRIIPFLSDRERHRVLSYLERLQVQVKPDTSLKRLTASPASAVLSDGTVIHDPLVCWSAGMRSDVTAVSGAIEHTRDGRIKTNEYLQIPGYPHVFAAGDAAALEKGGSPLRRAVNFAFYSGRRAGRNLARMVSGTATAGDAAVATNAATAGDRDATDTIHPAGARLKPFRPVDLGWVLPLGGTSVGRVFGVFRVRGKLGLRMHYFMCGFRHFGFREALEFYWTALNLSRSPDRLNRDDER